MGDGECLNKEMRGKIETLILEMKRPRTHKGQQHGHKLPEKGNIKGSYELEILFRQNNSFKPLVLGEDIYAVVFDVAMFGCTLFGVQRIQMSFYKMMLCLMIHIPLSTQIQL